MTCSNCLFFPAFRRGRCKGCYRYWLAMGRERPEDRYERAIQKVLSQAHKVC